MFKLFILYSHLLATCTALGVIIATDLQLLGKLTKPGLRIESPGKYVERLIMASLAALYVTGGFLIWLGLQERADYLLNPKLIGKLVLVGVLTANAVVLHQVVFPRLQKMKALSAWSASDRINIALPVALSNSLWMFCAFLGIARPWNFSMPLFSVLGMAAGVFAAVFCGVVLMLKFASLPRQAQAPREYDEHEFLAA
jgi:hypothetical protein